MRQYIIQQKFDNRYYSWKEGCKYCSVLAVSIDIFFVSIKITYENFQITYRFTLWIIFTPWLHNCITGMKSSSYIHCCIFNFRLVLIKKPDGILSTVVDMKVIKYLQFPRIFFFYTVSDLSSYVACLSINCHSSFSHLCWCKLFCRACVFL